MDPSVVQVKRAKLKHCPDSEPFRCGGGSKGEVRTREVTSVILPGCEGEVSVNKRFRGYSAWRELAACESRVVTHETTSLRTHLELIPRTNGCALDLFPIRANLPHALAVVAPRHLRDALPAPNPPLRPDALRGSGLVYTFGASELHFAQVDHDLREVVLRARADGRLPRERVREAGLVEMLLALGGRAGAGRAEGWVGGRWERRGREGWRGLGRGRGRERWWGA